MDQQLAVNEERDRDALGERLLSVLRDFCSAGDVGGHEPSRSVPPEGWPPVAMPEPADRELLAALRAALTRLADCHRVAGPERDDRHLTAILDGAHLTARTELLVGGGAEQVRLMVPGLVYLVVLGAADEHAARRAAAQAELRFGRL
jgi:hypothetical protein